MIRQWQWPGHAMTAASLIFLTLTPARAEDQPGVLWETTSQTVMEGLPMQMPMQRMNLCTPKVWTAPPPGGGQSCAASNFQRTGTKVTWTAQCTGEMEMTGQGEINFEGTDAYTGEIRFAAAEMNMTIKLTGKKIGGCDNPQ